MNAEGADLQPSMSKACSRCNSRKVKCDLQVPTCSSCRRQNEPCNIADCVAYPYSVVATLQGKIRNLEYQLEEAKKRNDHQSSSQEEQGGRAWAEAIRKEAEEVGTLAIGGVQDGADSQYIGSAAGSTFARIFFKMLNLAPNHDAGRGKDNLPWPELTERTAALPPRQTTRILFHNYIARVHTWWPVLPLPHLRRTIRRLYENPQGCNDYEKFVVFIVLALSSKALVDCNETLGMMDLNDPSAYFRTSLHFFSNFHNYSRNLQSLHCIIFITIWMLSSPYKHLHNDLWHLVRYAMSVAIELGLHRHSDSWGFSAEEIEFRNRSWWCVYALERQVAVVTGRVLSIRDHAIHTLKPSSAGVDVLERPEALAAPLFHRYGVAIFNAMIRLRQIGGRVLESVYIARGPDSKTLFTSFQSICSQVEEICKDLEQWKRELELLDIKHTREYYEIKIEYCVLLVLIHRPSPTFMIPSHQMVASCSKAASSAVRQWSNIKTQFGIYSIVPTFRTLHSILMVGLAAAYCDWYTVQEAQKNAISDDAVVYSHINDTALCLEYLDHCIHKMGDPSLQKYKSLLSAVRTNIYGAESTKRPSPTGISMTTNLPGSFNSLETANMDIPQEQWFSSEPAGVEGYREDVIGLFNENFTDIDEGLTAWYNSVLNEI